MRLKADPQGALDFEPSRLKITRHYYQKYEAISTVLQENPEILDAIHRDLRSPLKSCKVQRKDGTWHRYTSEQVLRILVAQIVEGASLREIVVRIDDSHYLRRFVRIFDGPMMDFTTLDKLKNAIRPTTWERIHRRLTEYAIAQERITGEKLRLDTTAVETNIHWPTDAALLWDLYRVLARSIEQARELDPDVVGDGRLQTGRTKKLLTRITRAARKKGVITRRLKRLYATLLGRVERICAWAVSIAKELDVRAGTGRYGLLEGAAAEGIAEEIRHFLPLAPRVLDQARRRVLYGEVLSNEEKIFSIFEPHTELLKRGKAGKPVEFGHMIQIEQVSEKFITGYRVFERKPAEPELLDRALDHHRELFDRYPKEIAADKGYYSGDVVDRLRGKVSVVSIAKKGKRTEEELEWEHDPLFRHAQRFRAGVEGTISFLKRVLGLARVFNKGWPHYVATVGMTMFVHNLLVLARC